MSRHQYGAVSRVLTQVGGDDFIEDGVDLLATKKRADAARPVQ